MKIIDLLGRDAPTLSFEVFPPKTDDKFESVRSAAEEIAALGPAFMSVTYGAGGGTSKYTLDIAHRIKTDRGVESLAHLTCVSSTRLTVTQRLADIRNAGIENIMALRGDMPEGMTAPTEESLAHATDLIALIKAEAPEMCIGAACYPEVHPESASQKEDLFFLKKKVEAGCDFFTTQMFFDNSLLYNFLYKLRESGVTVPVVAGVMPITNAKQVERAIKLSGSFMPRRFTSLVDSFGSDPAGMKQAGIIYAAGQIIDLYANGVMNVHVYTMNKPDVARGIVECLRGIISPSDG